MCVTSICIIVATGVFNTAGIAGNVTTTSLVVSNAIGTPNATALGNYGNSIVTTLILSLQLQGEYPPTL